MFSRRHPILFFMLAAILALIVSRLTGGEEHYSGEKIGIVEISGAIAESKEAIAQLKAFRQQDAIKAIVVRINSPGGAVSPSQEIYKEIRRTSAKKKVIVSMGALAASGGYYIASASDGIVANPGTITGSIGVIMGYTNFQQVLEKIGLYPVVIKSGEYKDMGSPAREMRPDERKILQGVIDQIHEQFVKAIADGRHLELAKVESLADGRIFTGEEALGLGLVDRLGNLEDAIQWAGVLAGIKGPVEAVYPPKERLSMLRYLTQSTLGAVIQKIVQPQLQVDYRYQP